MTERAGGWLTFAALFGSACGGVGLLAAATSGCQQAPETPCVCGETESLRSIEPDTARYGGEPSVVRLNAALPAGDVGYLVQLVCQRQGFCAEAGLQIETTLIERGQPLAGADAYLLGRGQLHRLETRHPGRLRVIALNIQAAGMGNDALVVAPSIPAITLAHLRHQPAVALVGRGRAVEPAVRMALSETGLDGVELKFFRSSYETLNDASWAVAYLREPDLSRALAEGKARILVEGPILGGRLLSLWPTSATAMDVDFLRRRPDVARRLVGAYDRSVRFIAENRERARALMAEYYATELKIAGAQPRLLRYSRSDQVSAELLQRQTDWFHSLGLSPSPRYVDHLLLGRAGPGHRGDGGAAGTPSPAAVSPSEEAPSAPPP